MFSPINKFDDVDEDDDNDDGYDDDDLEFYCPYNII